MYITGIRRGGGVPLRSVFNFSAISQAHFDDMRVISFPAFHQSPIRSRPLVHLSSSQKAAKIEQQRSNMYLVAFCKEERPYPVFLGSNFRFCALRLRRKSIPSLPLLTDLLFLSASMALTSFSFFARIALYWLQRDQLPEVFLADFDQDCPPIL